MQLLSGLYGKGMCVFAAKDSDTGKHVVIKDCWDPSETVSDYIVHLKLQNAERDPGRVVDGTRYIPTTEDDSQELPILIPAPEPNNLPEVVFAAQYDNHYSHTDPWADGKFLRGITIMKKYMQWKESIRSISTSMGHFGTHRRSQCLMTGTGTAQCLVLVGSVFCGLELHANYLMTHSHHQPR